MCRVPLLGRLAIQGFNGFARAALKMAVNRPERITATAQPSTGDNTVQLEAAVSDVLAYLSEHVGDVDGTRVAELSQLIASWNEIGQ